MGELLQAGLRPAQRIRFWERSTPNGREIWVSGGFLPHPRLLFTDTREVEFTVNSKGHLALINSRRRRRPSRSGPWTYPRASDDGLTLKPWRRIEAALR